MSLAVRAFADALPPAIRHTVRGTGAPLTHDCAVLVNALCAAGWEPVALAAHVAAGWPKGCANGRGLLRWRLEKAAGMNTNVR